MNVSELARQLRTSPQELYDLLPTFGFDIGRRAIKVDNRVANQIAAAWPRMYRRHKEDMEKKKGEEKLAKEIASALEGGSKTIELGAAITVRDFAERMNLPVTTVIRELLKNGILASLNERIDYDTASIIAQDFGFGVTMESVKKEEDTDSVSLDRLKNILESEKKEDLIARPPVVVVMGHVDHGKTKLLDAIRQTNVVAKESGGITQHIGAYQTVVPFKNEAGKTIDRALTFIDTPGHEAFTVMRSRGAKVADVAILVVAVDDGVQPQTKEALKIIEAAKLPYVVALNKIDKTDADIDKVKTQLSEIGAQPEEWGGKTVIVPISAKTSLNIDKLLEMVLLVADMDKDKITANPNRKAVGTIIESHIDPKAGPVATLLVQGGTLHAGEPLSIGFALYGKVRAMKNWKGDLVKIAPPSMPVQILGFKVAPAIGDVLEVPDDIKGLETKLKPTYLVHEKNIVTSAPAASYGEEGVEKKRFNIILRTDVLGSLEAILGSLQRMVHPEVEVVVTSKGLGSITDSDVLRAEASGATILGFHVPVKPEAERLAKDRKVVIKHYKIIYDLLGDVKKELEKLLPVEIKIDEIGKLEILAIFLTEKKSQIAGCRVLDGTIVNNLKVRIFRNKEHIADGELTDLQVGRQKVKDVMAGQECGTKIQTKEKLEVGDILEVYREEIKIKKLGF